MTPLEMIAEWRKGCSCAGPLYDEMFGRPEGTSSPAECEACTVGLIDALERALRQTCALEIEALEPTEQKRPIP